MIMFIFRCIKVVFKFYMLYIQPLVGFYLICGGLWALHSPAESTCVANTLESCTTSASEIVRAGLYLIIGIAVVGVWYLTDLKAKLRGEDKEENVKSGVKPEDFVK